MAKRSKSFSIWTVFNYSVFTETATGMSVVEEIKLTKTFLIFTTVTTITLVSGGRARARGKGIDRLCV